MTLSRLPLGVPLALALLPGLFIGRPAAAAAPASGADRAAVGEAGAGGVEEPVDDPKLARRLGTRIHWGGRAALAAEPPPPSGVLADTPEAEREGSFQPSSLPRFKLGYRRFEFVQLGAAGSSDGTVASQPFNSVSIDVYPLTTFVRVGLSTQYGWQSGGFATEGDYFAAQSLSLGLQVPGRRVVPFAEGFGGIGYMRRLQFDRTVPTVYWQFGVDAGAEIYFARAAYFSLALGYLRPVNGFARVQEFTTVFADSWSFKLGVGI